MNRHALHKPQLGLSAMALIALTALHPAPAHAQFLGDISARAAAMGGAYTAIADDAFALYWNPGALGGHERQELNTAFGSLHSTDISDNNIVYNLPFALHHGFGLGWRNSGFDDTELNFNSNQFTLGYGTRILDGKLGLGGNANLLTESISLDDGRVSEWSGWNAQFGAHWKINKMFSAGGTLRSLPGVNASHEGGASEERAENAQTWALGLAARPIAPLLFSTDLDDRFHLGAEYSYRGMVAVQGGFQRPIRDLYGEAADGNTWSMGIGARLKGFKFDFAHVMPPFLPPSNRVSIGVEFSLSPSKVAIVNTTVDNVYASQAVRYADNPVGTTKLISKSNEPLSIRVGFYVPDYMAAPTEQEIVLRPKETKVIDLNAIFSPEILALQEDRPARAEVLVSYQTKNRTRTEKAGTQLFVYRPGAISWSDLRAAAAFVTAQDPTVSGFARAVAQGTDVAGQGANLRNLYTAIWMFDALSEYGITYVPDPNNPFSHVSEERDAVDQVQYPRQLLTSRTGDCDDTSVLYCSMLENLGVPTAFLDGPGHILMMFDSGLHARNAQSIALSEDMYVIRNNRVWIPVETTLLGQPFMDAWLEGAAIWSRWKDNPQARMVEVQQAWLEYQPALPPGAAPDIAPPPREIVEIRVQRDIDSLRAWQKSYLEEKFLKPLEEANNLDRALEAGIVYAQEGRLPAARVEFGKIIGEDPANAAALNNLGNLDVLEDRPQEALALYEEARLVALDPGISLNQGLVLWSLGEQDRADLAFAAALNELDGDVDRALDLLGISAINSNEDAERGKTPLLTSEEIRQRLLVAAAQVPRLEPDTLTSEQNQEPPQVKPRSKVVSKMSGSRAADMQSVARVLYWKKDK